MTNLTRQQALGAEVERLISAYLTATREEVVAALGRALGHGPRSPSPRAAGRTPRSESVPRHRRTGAELEGLVERLATEVRARPGETMASLAASLQQPARELLRPMARLKERNQVRSIGQRNLTRYFPMP